MDAEEEKKEEEKKNVVQDLKEEAAPIAPKGTKSKREKPKPASTTVSKREIEEESSRSSLEDERQRLLELKRKLEEERMELDRIREEAFQMRDYEAEMYPNGGGNAGAGPTTTVLPEDVDTEFEWRSPPSLPPRPPVEDNSEEAIAARSAAKEGRRVFVSGEMKMESSIRIYFNKTASEPLREKSTVGIVGAFNNWKMNDFVSRMEPTRLPRDETQEWWSVDLTIPKESFCLNFVFFDNETTYDNNFGNDFLMEVVDGPDPIDLENQLALAASEAARMQRHKEAVEAATAAEREKMNEEKLEAERAAAQKTAREQADRHQVLTACLSILGSAQRTDVYCTYARRRRRQMQSGVRINIS